VYSAQGRQDSPRQRDLTLPWFEEVLAHRACAHINTLIPVENKVWISTTPAYFLINILGY
jgi:hypothetical protein